MRELVMGDFSYAHTEKPIIVAGQDKLCFQCLTQKSAKNTTELVGWDQFTPR